MTLDIDCFGFLFHFIVMGILCSALLMEAQNIVVSTALSLSTTSSSSSSFFKYCTLFSLFLHVCFLGALIIITWAYCCDFENNGHWEPAMVELDTSFDFSFPHAENADDGRH